MADTLFLNNVIKHLDQAIDRAAIHLFNSQATFDMDALLVGFDGFRIRIRYDAIDDSKNG
jgi:hypothetical protein